MKPFSFFCSSYQKLCTKNCHNNETTPLLISTPWAPHQPPYRTKISGQIPVSSTSVFLMSTERLLQDRGSTLCSSRALAYFHDQNYSICVRLSEGPAFSTRGNLWGILLAYISLPHYSWCIIRAYNRGALSKSLRLSSTLCNCKKNRNKLLGRMDIDEKAYCVQKTKSNADMDKQSLLR
jgi:hypothetical protein